MSRPMCSLWPCVGTPSTLTDHSSQPCQGQVLLLFHRVDEKTEAQRGSGAFPGHPGSWGWNPQPSAASIWALKCSPHKRGPSGPCSPMGHSVDEQGWEQSPAEQKGSRSCRGPASALVCSHNCPPGPEQSPPPWCPGFCPHPPQSVLPKVARECL